MIVYNMQRSFKKLSDVSSIEISTVEISVAEISTVEISSCHLNENIVQNVFFTNIDNNFKFCHILKAFKAPTMALLIHILQNFRLWRNFLEIFDVF